MNESSPPQHDPPTLLVTGVEGALGANIALALSGRFCVVGLCAGGPGNLDGCRVVPWDRQKPASLAKHIARERPGWIIHCAPFAAGSWDLPEDTPDGELETETCVALARAAATAGSRLTVLSTDAVFAGPRMFHGETRSPAGSRPAAVAALAAEAALAGSEALIVRTHAYGWSPAGSLPGFAERVWLALAEGQTASYQPDRHATPLLATDLAELLLRAYRRGLAGLYHVAGAERTSAYRFATELALAFGTRNFPEPAERNPADGPEPPDREETSLNSRRAQAALGRPMPMLREGLDRFAAQARNGLRARLQCGVRAAVNSDAA